MAGLRLGWAIASERISARIIAAASHLIGGTCSVAQDMALQALRSGEEERRRCGVELTANRDLAVAALAGTAGLRCDVPEGGIFLFPDVGTWLGNAPPDARQSPAAWLQDRYQLAVVDGSKFGAPDHVRLSFAVPRGMLLAGVTKLRRALEDTSK